MFVELDTRYSDGLKVRLEWDRDSEQTQIDAVRSSAVHSICSRLHTEDATSRRRLAYRSIALSCCESVDQD